MIIKFRSAKYDKKAHGGYIAGATFAFNLIISSIVATVGEVTATFTVKGAKATITVKTPGALYTLKTPGTSFNV